MKKKILIISKENKIAPVLQAKLNEEGYEVDLTEESGAQLKPLLRKVYPDLIIVSMNVSCLNAIELCLRIRRWSPIPLILINNWTSGLTVPENSRSCLLMKKETVEEIMARIEHAFSLN